MRLCAIILALGVSIAAAQPALAYGCFEPCPKGEVHSDELDMCVAVEAPST